jgi:hypothetical protein
MLLFTSFCHTQACTTPNDAGASKASVANETHENDETIAYDVANEANAVEVWCKPGWLTL